MDNLELVQKSFPFKTTTLSITDDRELTLTFKSLLSTYSFSTAIDNLSPRPTLHKNINAIVILIFSVSLVAVVLSIYLMMTTSDPENIGQKALIALLIFGMGLLLSVGKIKDAYAHLLLFRDGRTNDVLFSISPSSPSKEKVDIFIEHLEKQIKSISYSSSMTHKEMNAIYQKHLEFLLNESVIDPQEYDNIVSRLKKNTVSKIASLVK